MYLEVSNGSSVRQVTLMDKSRANVCLSLKYRRIGRDDLSHSTYHITYLDK